MSTAVDRALKDLREARCVVAQIYDAYCKPNWEEGTSLEEMMDRARDALANWDLDPCNNKAAYRKAVEGKGNG